MNRLAINFTGRAVTNESLEKKSTGVLLDSVTNFFLQ